MTFLLTFATVVSINQKTCVFTGKVYADVSTLSREVYLGLFDVEAIGIAPQSQQFSFQWLLQHVANSVASHSLFHL